LLEYPGALLVVTHDERLASALSPRLETWHLEDGQLRR
jgi:ATPase subunit of ABC transporter with duplicated ATPase domains